MLRAEFRPVDVHTTDGARFYRVAGDDRDHPSVTTVLAATGARKWGLERWRAKLGPELAATVSAIAADRGRQLHARIQHHRANPFAAYAPSGIDPWWASIRSYVRFLASASTAIAVELPMVHDVDGFGGTPDDVSMVAGELVITDWKTATAPVSPHVLTEYATQLAGYADLTAWNVGARPRYGVIGVAIAHAAPQIVRVDFDRALDEWRDRLRSYHGDA